MTIQFDKYQGAGNDFVILDNRQGKYNGLTVVQIAFICDRHKGVGADGLILINSDSTSDFQMQYFNSDGNESTLCGNGGRCAVAFAHDKNVIENTAEFNAVDGLHTALYDSPMKVKLEMQDVTKFSKVGTAIVTDTGSPHYIQLVDEVQALNIQKEGAAIRYSDAYLPEGINVNFVEKEDPTHYKIRTYERGVEGETLACGTGTVAAALAMHYLAESANATKLHFKAVGGDLVVSFEVSNEGYHSIFLTGPAVFVFSGSIDL
jgi:diaminopimelate epimerase